MSTVETLQLPFIVW